MMIRSFVNEVITIKDKAVTVKIKRKMNFRLWVLLIRIQYLFKQDLAQRNCEKLFTDLEQNMNKYIKVITKK